METLLNSQLQSSLKKCLENLRMPSIRHCLFSVTHVVQWLENQSTWTQMYILLKIKSKRNSCGIDMPSMDLFSNQEFKIIDTFLGLWSSMLCHYMAIHFGFTLSQSSLLQKLGSLYPYAKLMLKTSNSLRPFANLIIAVFYNSQANIPLKFKQFASCANMTIATCRMFAKPTIPEYFATMEVPGNDATIVITYIDQIIPPP